MRTISVRLDDRTDALLAAICKRDGSTQTGALKAAIAQLADQPRPTPAELAAAAGLIGAFRSEEGDLAANHSARVKERLRAKRLRDAMPNPPAEDAAAPSFEIPQR